MLRWVLAGCLLVPIGDFSLETSVFAREDLRKGAALYEALWGLQFPHRMHKGHCPECPTAMYQVQSVCLPEPPLSGALVFAASLILQAPVLLAWPFPMVLLR